MNHRIVVYSLLAAQAYAGTEDNTVDQISQNAIQSAFQILRKDYIRREEMTFDQLNRAALQGLLERLDFGADIVKDAPEDIQLRKGLLKESITPTIGYLRLRSYAADELPAIEAALKSFTAETTQQVILDLRHPSPPAKLETAAALSELFLPRGQVLFKLRQLGGGDSRLMISRRDPLWTGSLTVLVNEDSNNVAETTAGVLQLAKRAMVIGSTTRGATVSYQEVPLEKGYRLRFAAAEVLLADDASLFRRGVVPQFVVPISAEQRTRLFKRAEIVNVKDLVFEVARDRFNERALVSDKNPELDYYVSRSAGRKLSFDSPTIMDVVLQRAVDLAQNAAIILPGQSSTPGRER